MVSKKWKLEILFIDKVGKWYPIDEVDKEDLVEGLEKYQKKSLKACNYLKSKRYTVSDFQYF